MTRGPDRIAPPGGRFAATIGRAPDSPARGVRALRAARDAAARARIVRDRWVVLLIASCAAVWLMVAFDLAPTVPWRDPVDVLLAAVGLRTFIAVVNSQSRDRRWLQLLAAHPGVVAHDL